MKYKGGITLKYWKTRYQLAEDEFIIIPYWNHGYVYTDVISIRPVFSNGSAIMRVKKYFCWDGPSGPAIDTPNFMVPSLAHNVLYMLMRMEKIPPSYKLYADELMYSLCLERGMWKIRAKYCCWFVKTFAKPCILPENRRKIYEVL